MFSKGTCNSVKTQMVTSLGIPIKEVLGKYLECNIFKGRVNKSTFEEIIERSKKKLENWKANCLSKGGRTVLIQSNLEALPAHTMQCFELPKDTSSTLDKFHRDFFWKNQTIEKGMNMVSWDKMCRPKKLGGLGFGKTEAINKAFLAKLAWRVTSEEENLWIEVGKSKYLTNDKIMDRKTKDTDSWAWKKISKTRKFLREGMRWKLGNGKKIKFWTDLWSGDTSLLNRMNKKESEVDVNLKVQEFITNHKEWDIDRL